MTWSSNFIKHNTLMQLKKKEERFGHCLPEPLMEYRRGQKFYLPWSPLSFTINSAAPCWVLPSKKERERWHNYTLWSSTKWRQWKWKTMATINNLLPFSLQKIWPTITISNLQWHQMKKEDVSHFKIQMDVIGMNCEVSKHLRSLKWSFDAKVCNPS